MSFALNSVAELRAQQLGPAWACIEAKKSDKLLLESFANLVREDLTDMGRAKYRQAAEAAMDRFWEVARQRAHAVRALPSFRQDCPRYLTAFQESYDRYVQQTFEWRSKR